MKNPTIASWPLSGPSGIFHYMKQIFGILDDSQRQGWPRRDRTNRARKARRRKMKTRTI